MLTGYKGIVQKLLDGAGISINGSKSYDIQVHDERLYKRIVLKGSLGLGEAYMDGWWDVKQLDEFFYRLLKYKIDEKVKTWVKFLSNIKSILFNMQDKVRSKLVVKKHYDIGNDLYMSFLDPYNQYTCGYFEDTDDLNEAQEKKLALICKKLELSAKDKVLDIGCGWGGFMKYAAEKIGCHVTGISISGEQIRYAREFTKNLPVTFRKMDYRELRGKFDKVLVCGMLEHVGAKNYRRIIEIVHNCMDKSGKFLLHTIGGNTPVTSTDPWISTYIFPNSLLPSISQISKATEGVFVLEDLQNFGAYYDKTLLAWYHNFKKNWDTLKTRYDNRFFRMWEYYLLSCAGSFRARDNQLWQFVFTPEGQSGGMQYIRHA